MQTSIWVEMPLVSGEQPDDLPRPKYSVVGNATLVYRRPYVYIAFSDVAHALAAASYPDTRRLTPDEGRALETSLAFPIRVPVPSPPTGAPAIVGLGDLVSWVTGRLGIAECDRCRQRKRWLNRVVLWPRRRQQM
jgi:hypothetical protein